MPLVPTVDGPRVAQTALPDAYQRAPQALGDAGRVASGYADQASRVLGVVDEQYQRAKDEADRARVDEAFNAFVQSDTDLRIEASQLKGRAALERPGGVALPEEVAQRLRSRASELSQGLGNDEQRRAFRRLSERLAVQTHGAMSQHLAQQLQEHVRETAEARITVATDRGVKLWDQPDEVRNAAGAIADVVGAQSAREGWDDTRTQAELQRRLSPLHLGVIQSMLDGDQAPAAAEYLKAHSAGMTVEAALRAQGATRVAGVRAQATAKLDEMAGAGLDTAAMLAKARAMPAGEVRDELERRIEHRATVQATVQAKAVNEAADRAWTQAQQFGVVKPETVAELRLLNAGHKLAEVENYLDAKRRRAKADAEGRFTTDIGQYLRLADMARDPESRREFLALDLERMRPYLSDQDLKHFSAVKDMYAKGDARAEESARVVKETLSAIKYEVRQAGVDLTPKDTDKVGIERAQRFTYALTRALEEAQAVAHQQGKSLTRDDARRIGMGLVTQGVQQGSGLFGMGQTRRYGYELATDETIPADANFVAKRFDDIPTAARDALIGELIAKGAKFERSIYGDRPYIVPQEAQDAIEREYTRGLQSGRFRYGPQR